jgi:hypothetical protein
MACGGGGRGVEDGGGGSGGSGGGGEGKGGAGLYDEPAVGGGFADTLVKFLQMAPTADVLAAATPLLSAVVEEQDRHTMNTHSGTEAVAAAAAVDEDRYTQAAAAAAAAVEEDRSTQSIEAQQRTLVRCLADPIARRFPPGAAYRARLLKTATLAAEAAGCAVDDELAEVVPGRCCSPRHIGWHLTHETGNNSGSNDVACTSCPALGGGSHGAITGREGGVGRRRGSGRHLVLQDLRV